MKKKNFDFVGNAKKFWLISIGLLAVGVIFLVINGVELGLKFTGGAMFQYSYSNIPKIEEIAPEAIVPEADLTGEEASPSDIIFDAEAGIDESETPGGELEDVSSADIDATGFNIVPDYAYDVNSSDVESLILTVIGRSAVCLVSERIDIAEDEDNKLITINLGGNEAAERGTDLIILDALSEKYPNIEFTHQRSDSVGPSVGQEFFWKCIAAIILAAFWMIVYIALRFKKIGGWIAGVSAIIAIVHDCAFAFFTFVVFRFPIDDTYIAVTLTIIGYAINASIIIFDRIRENRRLLGYKASNGEIANRSINESLGRTINTNLCVGFALLTIAVIASIYNLTAITAFAVPMLVGIISGAYSSVCISGTVWVVWEDARAAKAAAKEAALKAARKKR